LKILIDIGHPAHVHLFRNLAKEMEKKHHEVLITCRDKEHTLSLLKSTGLKYICFGKPFSTRSGKLGGLLVFNYKMFRTLRKFRPDITLGHSSIYAAQMSWLMGIPHISMEDTGNMEQIRLYRPFTKAILVPESFHWNLGRKMIRYPGNHELAFLHPARFNPDKEQLKRLNLSEGSPFVILRFVAWKATHDAGHHGISRETKLKAISEFSRCAKVFISSETRLSSEFEPYNLPIPPDKIHDILAFSSLLYGESASMASEAAVLGVPAVYLDNTGRCYTREEEEKYGLVFNYSESTEDQERSLSKGVEILKTQGIKEEWDRRRKAMLKDKIDVTAFMLWFVEEWPESLRAMQTEQAPESFFSKYRNS
jgi:uncharacterized protein